jgi:hypothetical protein
MIPGELGAEESDMIQTILWLFNEPEKGGPQRFAYGRELRQ